LEEKETFSLEHLEDFDVEHFLETAQPSDEYRQCQHLLRVSQLPVKEEFQFGMKRLDRKFLWFAGKVCYKIGSLLHTWAKR
jgi:hypothetical protein